MFLRYSLRLALVIVWYTAAVAGAAEFTAPFSWVTTGPLLSPQPDAEHAIVSLKDPTVVFADGRWHVYATTADTHSQWSMAYLSFARWEEAAQAKPYFLDQNPNLRGYHCAPQVFYFRPQKKWYLIYQSQHPTYSTNDDVGRPEAWTAPRPFFAGTPKTVVDGWIDYWVICDDTHAYLFFSDDNGRYYRSRTRREDFPNGFEDPVVIMQDPNRFNLFEASCVYRLKGLNRYLCIIECLGEGGHRYFRAFTSDRLDGQWEPLAGANDWKTPFLGANNVTATDGGTPWSADISHGEMLRAGNDETMTIDPAHLQFLYQGMARSTTEKNYALLPYRLALLTAKPAVKR
jgi:hypothetical protein